jgi:iron complex transport system substrate-binding protein
MRSLRVCTLFLVCSLCLICPAGGRELVDQIGRKVEVTEPLTRVVSLAPSLTETSYEVGGGAALVGATQYANHPEQAMRLPRVGSYVALDIEKIVSLEPQLCLAIRDGNPKATVEKLESLGIPVYVFDPQSLEEIVDVVTRLGEVYGTADYASNLAELYQQRLKRVASKVAGVQQRPKVFFQIDAQPIISAGSETFLDELLARAGAVNLAADRSGYPRYSWEELLLLNPEVVLLASMGGGYSDAELRGQWQQWPQIDAVQSGRLFVVEADLFDRPTSRLIDALEFLIELLHPGR